MLVLSRNAAVRDGIGGLAESGQFLFDDDDRLLDFVIVDGDRRH